MGSGAALLVFGVALVLLLANGRPIGEPDTSGAAGWLLRGCVALAGQAGVEVDATGTAVLGKLLAAFCAALAGAALFAAVSRRHPADEGRWAGVALALGTTLTAAAQGFSGEAPATAALALGLWLLVRAEDEDDAGGAARAGLPLALAAALLPVALPLVFVLWVSALFRWRTAWLSFLVWSLAGALPGAVGTALAAGHASKPLPAAEDPSVLALLASPAKGALVFVPLALVAVVGLVRALSAKPARRMWDQPAPSRLLTGACAFAFVAHFASVALVGGWSQGVFWGPRLLAPAWPLALLFLPEGLELLRLGGTLLVVASIAIQALGLVTYDGRWDRLTRDARGGLAAVAWAPERSPLVFQWRERVVRPSLPGLEGKRIVVREHALVRGGESGSFVSFREGRLRLTGADATMESLHLEQGARVEGERLLLRSTGDGVAFRVREGARLRHLELRVSGHGQGMLAVAEKGFWKAASVHERPVSGTFRLRVPYAFAESGAADLSFALRAGGPLTIDSFSLVPPTEPENVIRLP